MKMKKITAALFTAIICVSLVACGNKKEDTSNNSLPSKETSSSVSSDIDVNNLATEEPEQEPFYVNFETTDLNGGSVSSEEFGDYELTIVNIWGTWCPPCVAELPELQKVSEAYADKNVRVIGMLQDGVKNNLEKDEKIIENAKTLLEEAGANYTVALPDITFYSDVLVQIQAFPTTLFIGSEGELLYMQEGALDYERWSELIDIVLEKNKK